MSPICKHNRNLFLFSWCLQVSLNYGVLFLGNGVLREIFGKLGLAHYIDVLVEHMVSLKKKE